MNTEERVYEFSVSPEEELVPSSLRWDRYISAKLEGISRNQIQENLVSLRVNGQLQKLSSHVKPGDKGTLILQTPKPSELIPKAIDLEIIYENSDVIVINKPRGLVVHPGAGNWDHTLVHGILYYLQQQGAETIQDTDRPGIVHRLDKDTTGVMVVAKHKPAHEFLAKQFSQRTTKKTYLALSSIDPVKLSQIGKYHEPQLIETILGRSDQNRQIYRVLDPDSQRGKLASTRIQLVGLGKNKDVALFRLGLLTGRTHQIRVHLRYLGFPILGDRIYGDKHFHSFPMLLHAAKLTIQLPGEQAPRTFNADPPQDFLEVLDARGVIGIDSSVET